MYIKNQTFSDEDTLLEMLFDFEIGEASDFMKAVLLDVNSRIDADKELAEHIKTLEEEEGLELHKDIQLEQLAKSLQQSFSSFSVYKAGLYGHKANDEKVLLYQIDLY